MCSWTLSLCKGQLFVYILSVEPLHHKFRKVTWNSMIIRYSSLSTSDSKFGECHHNSWSCDVELSMRILDLGGKKGHTSKLGLGAREIARWRNTVFFWRLQGKDWDHQTTHCTLTLTITHLHLYHLVPI